MSQSVTLSIVTNSVIAATKFAGWMMTGSPTLFAETIHSAADVSNQLLLKVGEVRARAAADARHPFGRGQERFFWALVSAVSVFFVGCGVTVYHGIHSLLDPQSVEPFTLLPVGLLLLAFALESFTLRTALKEIGGFKGIAQNRSNTTVLAVLLEDVVALVGIALTLLVGGLSLWFGPMPALDACVSILVGLILGAMALFLANTNRSMLIDVADTRLNQHLVDHLGRQGVAAEVSSLTMDVDRYVVFVRVRPGGVDGAALRSWDLGEGIKASAARLAKIVDAVYWKFPYDDKPAVPGQPSSP